MHIHRDRHRQKCGGNVYYHCRCGAMRVRRIRGRSESPVAPGWPRLRGRHGESMRDTGWRRPPCEGERHDPAVYELDAEGNRQLIGCWRCNCFVYVPISIPSPYAGQRP